MGVLHTYALAPATLRRYLDRSQARLQAVVTIRFAAFGIFLVFNRRPHAPSFREAAVFSAFYVALGILFGILVFATRGGVDGVTVRVTNPSRSSPRKERVSIRWEMPSTIRFNSLKRRGPFPSMVMISTLHLSPTRPRTSDTARQFSER